MKTTEHLIPTARSNPLASQESSGHAAGSNGLELREESIRLQELGRAAAFLAHELRQPLAVIQNLACYLKSAVVTDNPNVSDNLKLLEQQAELAGRVLSNLVAFARSGAPSSIPTDLHRVIREALKRIPWRTEIRLQRKLAPQLPAVWADPIHVDTILLNLIVNGLESMDGPGTLTITTRAEPSGILLQISDTGCGIDPAKAATVFQPFVTTKCNGTGMGLPLCRELAEANGGSIVFKSQPGKGTTFELRLPRA